MAAILAAGVLALGGCSSSETGTVTSDTSVTESTPVSEEQPVILAVSFGTSYNDSREKTIGAIEKAIQEANPNCEVRRAFTSQTVIDILKKRDNIEIDNVEEALQRLVDDGVKKLGQGDQEQHAGSNKVAVRPQSPALHLLRGRNIRVIVHSHPLPFPPSYFLNSSYIIR